jgi:hypothetical protein
LSALTSRRSQSLWFSSALALMTAIYACGGDGDETDGTTDDADGNNPDGNNPDGNNTDGNNMGQDAGQQDTGPHDPYWTDYDAAVDIVPDAEPPARQHVWTSWKTAKNGEDGGASGTLAPTADTTITVTYSGQFYNAQLNAMGTPFWTPPTPYVSVAVPNAPLAVDQIQLAGGDGRVHELAFSVPVENPVISVMSMGSNEMTTVVRFDDDFDLLSFGPGYYGQGMPLKHLPDHVLSGRESSGTIRFNGKFSVLRWKTVLSEPWFGLTVGIPTPQNP